MLNSVLYALFIPLTVFFCVADFFPGTDAPIWLERIARIFFIFCYIFISFIVGKRNCVVNCIKNNDVNKSIAKRLADFCEKISVASYFGMLAPFFNDKINVAQIFILLILAAFSMAISIELTKALVLAEKNES